MRLAFFHQITRPMTGAGCWRRVCCYRCRYCCFSCVQGCEMQGCGAAWCMGCCDSACSQATTANCGCGESPIRGSFL
jgi:hypothetical protein